MIWPLTATNEYMEGCNQWKNWMSHWSLKSGLPWPFGEPCKAWLNKHPAQLVDLPLMHVRVPSFFWGGKSSMMFQTKHQPNVSKFKDYTVLATVSYVRSSVILSYIVSYYMLHHILHCNCHIYIKSSYIILPYLMQMYSIVGGFNPSEKY